MKIKEISILLLICDYFIKQKTCILTNLHFACNLHPFPCIFFNIRLVFLANFFVFLLYISYKPGRTFYFWRAVKSWDFQIFWFCKKIMVRNCPKFQKKSNLKTWKSGHQRVTATLNGKSWLLFKFSFYAFCSTFDCNFVHINSLF